MGLLRAAATTAVVAGTATAVSGRVASRQAAKAAPPPAPAPAPMAAPMAPAPPEASNGAAKIQELAQMHAQGFITDEEFAAAKAKALGI
ncbi:MAG: SHOCT domain-containing protein [Actinobacteria bacterium]|nr:SHOCT domain-containing protein [Actinomycetota bacterium]